jgi:hypothetical protein
LVAPERAKERIPNIVTRILQGVLLVAMAGAVYERQWLNVVLVAGILGLTLLNRILRRPFFRLPPEFGLAAILFVFASVFLGEVRGYYLRFWWWDVLLHAGSAFLLGVTGFLLVYALNEDPKIDLHMRPRFLALFAFAFAMAMGGLWEVFEFAMDQLFGSNMQKSGLVDTMWDLIVDALAAGAVSVYGGYHLHRGGESFIERWITEFVERNPALFHRGRGRGPNA